MPRLSRLAKAKRYIHDRPGRPTSVSDGPNRYEYKHRSVKSAHRRRRRRRTITVIHHHRHHLLSPLRRHTQQQQQHATRTVVARQTGVALGRRRTHDRRSSTSLCIITAPQRRVARRPLRPTRRMAVWCQAWREIPERGMGEHLLLGLLRQHGLWRHWILLQAGHQVCRETQTCCPHSIRERHARFTG